MRLCGSNTEREYWTIILPSVLLSNCHSHQLNDEVLLIFIIIIIRPIMKYLLIAVSLLLKALQGQFTQSDIHASWILMSERRVAEAGYVQESSVLDGT